MGLYQFFSSLWTSTDASGGALSIQPPVEKDSVKTEEKVEEHVQHASVHVIQAEGDG